MKNTYNLSIIKTDETNGIFSVVPNLASVYRIEVSDFYGNKTTISIPIQYDLLSTIIDKEPVISNYFVKANKDSNFAKENMSVFFPAGTFYDDFDLNFDVKNDTYFFMMILFLLILILRFLLKIINTMNQKSKMFIGMIEGKKINYNPTFSKDSLFTTKSKT